MKIKLSKLTIRSVLAGAALVLMYSSVFGLDAVAPIEIHGVGFLQGQKSDFSEARGVDRSGKTVVGTIDSKNGRLPFGWTEESGLFLPRMPNGFPNGSANAVAGSSIVGTLMTSTGLEHRPFLWRTDFLSRMAEGLGSLPGGTQSGFGMDVASVFRLPFPKSIVVGGSNSSFGFECFHWTVAGGMKRMGFLSGAGVNSSFATAISGNGRFIAGNSASRLPTEIFLWENNVMRGLRVRGGAHAVSDDGLYIAGTDVGVVFRLRTDGSAQPELISFPPSYDVERIGALDMSADGTVFVGSVDIGGTNDIAFIWFEGHDTAIDLNDLLGAFGQDDGWQLTAANGISANGLAIAGTGLHQGKKEGFLLRFTDCDGNGVPDFLDHPEFAGISQVFDVDFRVNGTGSYASMLDLYLKKEPQGESRAEILRRMNILTCPEFNGNTVAIVEELALLHGREDAGAEPVFHRLPPNVSGSALANAYRSRYGVTTQAQAEEKFPQGLATPMATTSRRSRLTSISTEPILTYSSPTRWLRS